MQVAVAAFLVNVRSVPPVIIVVVVGKVVVRRVGHVAFLVGVEVVLHLGVEHNEDDEKCETDQAIQPGELRHSVEPCGVFLATARNRPRHDPADGRQAVAEVDAAGTR